MRLAPGGTDSVSEVEKPHLCADIPEPKFEFFFCTGRAHFAFNTLLLLTVFTILIV